MIGSSPSASNRHAWPPAFAMHQPLTAVPPSLALPRFRSPRCRSGPGRSVRPLSRPTTAAPPPSRLCAPVSVRSPRLPGAGPAPGAPPRCWGGHAENCSPQPRDAVINCIKKCCPISPYRLGKNPSLAGKRCPLANLGIWNPHGGVLLKKKAPGNTKGKGRRKKGDSRL
jgi:hypothetical protein